MKKQIPNGAFIFIIFVALAGALWSLGKATPSSSSPAASAGRLPAPVPAPVIEGTTTKGDTFRLSDYKGKVVMLNCWATWCGPCRMEIPDLVALQKKYEGRGFTIVGLSDDDDLEKPKAFAAQNDMTYPILLMSPDVHRAFNIEAIPTTLLVDKEGRVVWSRVGLITQDDVSSEIEKLL